MSRGVVIPGLSRRLRGGIYDHVYDNHTHEVGGVLVGQLGDGEMPRVTGCIAALEARGERASVTFTHDAWESIHASLERDHPGDQIVGWYHSHPGFGIFLSNHDLFIHENFFSDPRQIAYVVDPHAGTEGVFGWRDGKVTVFEEGPAARRGTGGAGAERGSEDGGDWLRYGGLALVLAVLVGVGAGIVITGGVSDPPVDAAPNGAVTTTTLTVPGVAGPASPTTTAPPAATATQPAVTAPQPAAATTQPVTTTQPATTQTTTTKQRPPAKVKPRSPPPPPPPPPPAGGAVAPPDTGAGPGGAPPGVSTGG